MALLFRIAGHPSSISIRFLWHDKSDQVSAAVSHHALACAPSPPPAPLGWSRTVTISSSWLSVCWMLTSTPSRGSRDYNDRRHYRLIQRQPLLDMIPGFVNPPIFGPSVMPLQSNRAPRTCALRAVSRTMAARWQASGPQCPNQPHLRAMAARQMISHQTWTSYKPCRSLFGLRSKPVI